jgi:uncharacterized protein (TIGR02757 family)
MPRRDWNRVREVLDGFLERRRPGAALAADPVSFPRRYAGRDDREVAGLLAACLAFGRVASIRAKIADALSRMGDSPAAYVDALAPRRALADFKGWHHRMAKPRHLVQLLAGMQRVRRRHGSLGAAFAAFPGSVRDRLTAFSEALGPVGGNLLANPRTGSPCKRLNLYLRWMIRPDDGIDLGIWKAVPPSDLIIPLDTHIHRIARYVGFTRLRTPRWETAAEVTRALARLDPSDPIKYDFALCHLGIAGDCPKHRVAAICAGCDLKEVCRLPGRDGAASRPDGESAP